MHVGLLSPKWPPTQVSNGIVTYVGTVHRELLRLGHRVSVFSGDCQDDPSSGVYRVESGRPTSLLRAVRRRLSSAVNEQDGFGAQIKDCLMQVHANDPLDVFEMEESFGWCATVARNFLVPTIVRLHGPAFLSWIADGQHELDREQKIAAEGRALLRVKNVMSPSRSTADAVAQRYGMDASRFEYLSNPVDLVDELLVWQPKETEERFILFIGRFDHRKGADFMISAFASLAIERPGLKLKMAGPDIGVATEAGVFEKFAEYVERRVPCELADRIAFLGVCSNKELQQLRAECSVVAICSRWESFGYVVAEALMQGCAVSALDVPGVNELITHGRTGLLAPLGDVAAFNDNLSAILDDSELASHLGSSARQHALSELAAPIIVTRMVSHYRSVIGSTA